MFVSMPFFFFGKGLEGMGQNSLESSGISIPGTVGLACSLVNMPFPQARLEWDQARLMLSLCHVVFGGTVCLLVVLKEWSFHCFSVSDIHTYVIIIIILFLTLHDPEPYINNCLGSINIVSRICSSQNILGQTTLANGHSPLSWRIFHDFPMKTKHF